MKPLTYNKRSIIFFICSVVIVVMLFTFQVFNFGDLQREVPSHFNFDGAANDYMKAKSFLMFTFSFYFLLIALLFGISIGAQLLGEKFPTNNSKNLEKYIVEKLSKVLYLSLKLTLFDALTLILLSTSSFIYFINYSVINYEVTKKFLYAPVYLSFAIMLAVVLVFVLGRTTSFLNK